MTDDLVRRLDMASVTTHPMTLVIVIREAAACIEKLKKERDEWKLRTMAAMHFVPDNVTFGEIRNIRAALAGEKKDA